MAKGYLRNALVIATAFSLLGIIYFLHKTSVINRWGSVKHVVYGYSKQNPDEMKNENDISSLDFDDIVGSVNTSFKQFGLDELPMLKRMDIKRPLFNITIIPWKILARNNTLYSEDCRWSTIVAVKSAYNRAKQRDRIRNAWGSNKILNGVCLGVIFAVASTKTADEEADLKQEQSIHGDILQVELEETYPNIGLKALASMQWIGENFPSNWVYSSADDDMQPDLVLYYKDVETIMREDSSTINSTGSPFQPLDTKTFPTFCAFWHAKYSPPKRYECKWKIDVETYPYEYYPPFCLGGFYSMSVKQANAIYSVSRWYPYFHLDDVWITGFMRLKVCDLIKESDFTFNKLDIYCGISELPGNRVTHLAL